MKTFAFIFIIAFIAVSCSAMPPAHKPPPSLLKMNMPPVGDTPVTGANVYKAQFADTAWTPAGSVNATNGTVASVSLDLNFPLWVAESTNSQLQIASDYSLIFTNVVLTNPSNLTTK